MAKEKPAQPSPVDDALKDFQGIGETVGEVHCILNMAAGGNPDAKKIAAIVGNHLQETYRLKLNEHVDSLLRNRKP